jgi:hypothetical protein
MLSSIRVNANNNGALDVMSRVNFGKIYTVEHNVKVFDFGQVHNESRLVLNRQFWEVLNRRSQRNTQPVGTTQTIAEVDEDGEDDDSDDDSDSSSEVETVVESSRERQRRGSHQSRRRRR